MPPEKALGPKFKSGPQRRVLVMRPCRVMSTRRVFMAMSDDDEGASDVEDAFGDVGVAGGLDVGHDRHEKCWRHY